MKKKKPQPSKTLQKAGGKKVKVYTLADLHGTHHGYLGFTDEAEATKAMERFGRARMYYSHDVLIDPDLSKSAGLYVSATVHDHGKIVARMDGTFKDKKSAMLAMEASGLFNEEDLAQMNNSDNVQLPGNYRQKRALQFIAQEALVR
jgi:hypothetical protein